MADATPYGYRVSQSSTEAFALVGLFLRPGGITGIHTSVFLVLKLIIDSDGYNNYGSKDSL
ncbi:MAG: hypothetical protein HC862_05020 [Scytonema sp. RU_4_4]|nr:hypothetical protein [Scytonema sp. RU_4_4]